MSTLTRLPFLIPPRFLVLWGLVEIAEKAEEQWNCGGGANAQTVHKKGLLLDTHTQFLDRVLKELQGMS